MGVRYPSTSLPHYGLDMRVRTSKRGTPSLTRYHGHLRSGVSDADHHQQESIETYSSPRPIEWREGNGYRVSHHQKKSSRIRLGQLNGVLALGDKLAPIERKQKIIASR